MSSKPIVRTLASAAAPTLRAWVDTHASAVESVVDGVLAVPDDVVLVPGANEQEVFTPLAFGDVADLKADGLTDEERKRALSWLKKRASRLEGDFDAEDANLAISLLPGWSSEILTTLRAVPMNATTADGAFPRALVEAGFVHAPVKGNRDPSLGGWRGASNIEGVSSVTVYGDKEETLRVTPEIAATFRPFDAKKVKVKDLPAGRWAGSITQRGDGDVNLTKPVLVFAEQGGLRVTNATGQTAEVSGGKSGWKALYGESVWKLGEGSRTVGGLGLKEAADGVVGAVERRVQARAAFAEGNTGWGGAMCPVCFQRAAVTPTTRHMVDHRHKRPGWGYNVQPCEGNQFPPYKESPAGSEATLANLRSRVPALIEQLRRVIAHPEEQSYPVKVYVMDAQGRPVYDLVPSPAWAQRKEKKQRTETVVIRKGHIRFRDFYAQDIKRRKAEILAAANAIPFFASAVRVWKPGLDTAEPINAGIRQTDKPALPADLFGAA